MTRLLEGPLAYLDVPTSDGRLLPSEGLHATNSLVVPVRTDFDGGGNCRARVIGVVRAVEKWGNVLWAYGDGTLPDGASRVFAEIGVSPGPSLTSPDGILRWEDWALREVVIVAAPRGEVWKGHQTYLEYAQE